MGIGIARNALRRMNPESLGRCRMCRGRLRKVCIIKHGSILLA